MGDNYNKILNIACAAIVKDNSILLVNRIKPPYKGWWSMTGGKIEFGEYPEDAVLREVKEETNLDCELEGFMGIATEIIHNKNKKVCQLMLYIFRLKPISSKIIATEGELKWFPIDELKKHKDIVPSDIRMIEEFIIKKSNKLHKIKMIEEKGGYRLEEFSA